MVILGGSGFLGSTLVEYFSKDFEIVFSYNDNRIVSKVTSVKLDASNLIAVEEFIRVYSPNVVVNAIAHTNVDQIERNPNMSFGLNVELPIFLASLSVNYGFKLIHISTDHFLSLNTSLIKEEDFVLGVNAYGKQKLEAETGIMSCNSDAVIVRTNFFKSDPMKRKGLFEWIVGNLSAGMEISSYVNILFTPVSCKILAHALCDLLKIEYSGLINVASNTSISKYDFARFVAKEMKLNENLVIPTIFAENDKFVIRPEKMALDNSRFVSLTRFYFPSVPDMIRHEVYDRNLEL